MLNPEDRVEVGQAVWVTRAYRLGKGRWGVDHCGCDACWETDRYLHPFPAVVTKIHKPRRNYTQGYSIRIDGEPGVWTCTHYDVDLMSIVEAVGLLAPADVIEETDEDDAEIVVASRPKAGGRTRRRRA